MNPSNQLLEAWESLLKAQKSEKASKELCLKRAALTRVVQSTPLHQTLLGDYILNDLKSNFAPVLQIIVECATCRQSLTLNHILESVLPPLESNIHDLIELVLVENPEVSPVYINRLTLLEQYCYGASSLSLYYHLPYQDKLCHSISRIVEKFNFRHQGGQVKLLRAACLSLCHLGFTIPLNLVPLGSLSHTAILFAQVSVSKTNGQVGLVELAPLLSKTSVEEEEECMRLVLALEGLSAWVSNTIPSQEEEIVLALALCLRFSNHVNNTLLQLSQSIYERLINASFKLGFGESILHVVWVEHLDKLSPSSSKGSFVVLDKLIQVVGAQLILSWSPQVVSEWFSKTLTPTHRHVLDVVGNGLCGLLCTLLQSWMRWTAFKLTKELKSVLFLILQEMMQKSQFALHHLMPRFLTDWFIPCQEGKKEISFKREVGVFWLQHLAKEASSESLLWTRMNVVLALERSGTHIRITHSETPLVLYLSSKVLQTCLLHKLPEIQGLAWSFVGTRVKRTRFPSLLLLNIIQDALRTILHSSEGHMLKPHLMKLVDRLLFLLNVKRGMEEEEGEIEEEDARQACQDFMAHLCESLAVLVSPETPISILSLVLQLGIYLLPKVKLNPMRLPLFHKATVNSLLELMLSSSFDSIRTLCYQWLGLIDTPWESQQELNVWMDRIHQRLRQSRSISRRECDGIALVYRLIHTKCTRFSVLLFEQQSSAEEEGIVVQLLYALRPISPTPAKVIALMTLKSFRWHAFESIVVQAVLDCLTFGLTLWGDVEKEEMERDVEEEEEEEEAASWMILREGSETLSLILEDVVHHVTPGNNEDLFLQCSHWFFTTVLKLKHLGAMTWITKGLEAVTKVLLAHETFSRIVTVEWIPSLQVLLHDPEQRFDLAIRRSDGFAFASRAIVRASESLARPDVVHLVMSSLWGKTSIVASAPLHVLHSLFNDSLASKVLATYISPSLQCALLGFDSPEWKVRSASLGLFVSLMKRVVGDQPLKSNAATFHTVFDTFPSLSLTIWEKLAAADSEYLLHPILLFLSALKPSESGKIEAQFLPLVQVICQGHSNFHIRAVAASALVALGGRIEFSSCVSENELHGFLLFLSHSHGRGGNKKQLLSLVQSHKNSFLVRELALECLEPLVSPAELFSTLLPLVDKSTLALSDGHCIGRSRFNHRAYCLLIKAGAHLEQWQLVSQLVLHLPLSQKFKQVFEILALELESNITTLLDLHPLVTHFSQHFESLSVEQVNCLAVLLQKTSQVGAIPDELILNRLSATKDRNIALSCSLFKLLGSSQSPMYLSLVQTFASPEQEVVEYRQVACMVVGQRLLRLKDEESTQLELWICLLQLLVDENPELRQVAETLIGSLLDLDLVGFALLEYCWGLVTLKFGHLPRWKQQLQEWLFVSPQVLESRIGEMGHIGFLDLCTVFDLSWKELRRIKHNELVAQVLVVEEYTSLAKRTCDDLELVVHCDSFLMTYSRLCAALVYGDPLSLTLRSTLERIRDCCSTKSYALLCKVIQVEEELWGLS